MEKEKSIQTFLTDLRVVGVRAEQLQQRFPRREALYRLTYVGDTGSTEPFSYVIVVNDGSPSKDCLAQLTLIHASMKEDPLYRGITAVSLVGGKIDRVYDFGLYLYEQDQRWVQLPMTDLEEWATYRDADPLEWFVAVNHLSPWARSNGAVIDCLIGLVEVYEEERSRSNKHSAERGKLKKLVEELQEIAEE